MLECVVLFHFKVLKVLSFSKLSLWPFVGYRPFAFNLSDLAHKVKFNLLWICFFVILNVFLTRFIYTTYPCLTFLDRPLMLNSILNLSSHENYPHKIVKGDA
jgi:hypothetical protein